MSVERKEMSGRRKKGPGGAGYLRGGMGKSVV